MGQKSKIEWTDATWNPTTGCTKVSDRVLSRWKGLLVAPQF